MLKRMVGVGRVMVMVEGKEWLRGKERGLKEGELYMVIMCRLVGMKMMVSGKELVVLLVGVEMVVWRWIKV